MRFAARDENRIARLLDRLKIAHTADALAGKNEHDLFAILMGMLLMK